MSSKTTTSPNFYAFLFSFKYSLCSMRRRRSVTAPPAGIGCYVSLVQDTQYEMIMTRSAKRVRASQDTQHEATGSTDAKKWCFRTILNSENV